MSNAAAPTRRAFLAGVTATGASLALSNPILALGAVPQTGSPDEAWLNPPKHWRTEGSSLVCTADPKTDFWRKTFYGYVTDTGHLRYRRVRGDFTTQVKVSGQYRDLYDQASWATGRLSGGPSSLWLKVVRKGPALHIFHSLDGSQFVESGVGYLGTADSAMVGPMFAAPEGNGFEMRFDDWTLKPGG